MPKTRPSRFITLPDGRIFRIEELVIHRPEPNARIRYRCHVECAQYSEPRDDFDFEIYLHHELFRRGHLSDSLPAVAWFAHARAAMWLEHNRCRVRWTTEAVEIHCTGRPEPVYVP